MRTIGLVGGLTPESTLEYYRLLIRFARERLRDPDPLRNPVVIIYSLDLAVVAALQRAGRTDELAAHLSRICELLRGAGAEIGALTANTPHLYLEAIEHRGADGVILGCTELPLAISQDDLAVPVIDTLRVHVRAILDRALA